MIKRAELREEIEAYVQRLIEGETPERPPVQEVVQPVADKPDPGRNERVPDFVPSRGDEPYLYKPQDPELAARCSAILDGLEYIEGYVWDALERNRE